MANLTSVEEWRPVVGFQGYEVSNLGRIRSYRARWRSRRVVHMMATVNAGPTTRGRKQYLQLRLRRNGRSISKYVHSLVAEAFVGPCPDGREVNHKDGNKKNCSVDNLEYVTPGQNVAHAWAMGLRRR